MNKKIKVYTGIILSIMVSALVFSCIKKEHHELSQFISPDTCGGCHDEIFDQWQNSMHGLAHKDPLYREVALFLRKELTERSEVAEAESCVKCHTPVGYITGITGSTTEELTGKNIPGILKQGIQCDYCHSATGAKKMYNNGLTLKPGRGEDEPGIKRGPYSDSKSDFHDSAFSEFHTSSEICGTCHNVNHVVYGTKLESTFDEWENSPYNSSDPNKRITCQGCHMYQRPGVPATGETPRPLNPGYASADGPERPHVFTHYFVGGNTLVPGMFRDSKKGKMAEERLKNAAGLSIDYSGISSGNLIVSVKNTGAGHYLPTGLTDTRQMWLEISVKNERGGVVYSSGKLDKDGYITDNTFIYNTVFGDGKGNAVTNIAKAKEIIKDRRIPPLKSLDEKIEIGKGNYKKLNVRIRLLYRIAPQKLADQVLGKGKLKLPVVQMEELNKIIKI